METTIYHGGGMGRGGGFALSTPNPDTVRFVATHNDWYADWYTVTAEQVLPTPNNGSGFNVWEFDPSASLISLFSLPHKQWTWELGAAPPSGLNVRLHFYHSEAVAAPNNNVTMFLTLSIVRAGETINFVPPISSTARLFTIDCSTPAYDLIMIDLPDIVLHNPSGLTPHDEPIFWARLWRGGPGSTPPDTYTSTLHFLGGLFEFPLK